MPADKVSLHVKYSMELRSDVRNLEEARGEIAILRDEIAELQRRLEKQAVLMRALYTLLSEKPGPTETELLDRFRQLEAERVGFPAKMCSLCGRPVNLRHNRCLYCGADCQVQSAFELLEMNLPLQPTAPASWRSEEYGITARPGG